MLLLLLLTAGCWTRPYEKGPQASRIRQSDCVNLNTASIRELEELPGVGEVIARRIVEYRQRGNRFRRPQDVIIIEGFSERKYRTIADRVCVE